MSQPFGAEFAQLPCLYQVSALNCVLSRVAGLTVGIVERAVARSYVVVSFTCFSLCSEARRRSGTTRDDNGRRFLKSLLFGLSGVLVR